MKKKLSLLLAAMLVMTLIPVSSFAVETSKSAVDSVEVGTVKHTVSLKLTEEDFDAFTDGSLQFDVTGGAKFTGIKMAINGASTDLYAPDSAKKSSVFSVVDLTAANTAKDAVTFTFDLNFVDAKEGEEVKVSITDLGKKTGLAMTDVVMAKVKAESSTGDLAITVKDKDTKASQKGGSLSQFTVKNFKNAGGQELTITLDNGAKYNSDTKIYLDGVAQTAAQTAAVGSKSFTITVPKTATTLIVQPSVNATNSDLGDVTVEIVSKDEDYSSSAIIGEIVDYGVTLKVVENGKKEIPTVIGGKNAKIKVTMEGTKGSITEGREYTVSLDGAKVEYDKAGKVAYTDNADIDGIYVKGFDKDGGTSDEFVVVPGKDAEEMKFVIEVKVSATAKDGVATMTVSSRDLSEDLTADIANVNQAYSVDTKVTEIRRGESLETADITITEDKVGQLSTSNYVYLIFNGKMYMNEKPEVEGTNGLKFDKVEWVKDGTNSNANTVGIRAKVTAKSKGEPGEITFSGMTVDMASNAIHNRTYTTSFFVGTEAEKVSDVIAKSDKITEFAEIDYAKCVAEYSKTAAKIVFTLGSANYTVDGVVKTLEAPVFTKDNRTMLPIGPLALALGLDVNYNGDTQTATFRDSFTGQVVSVKENASVLYNNGIEYKMHTTAVTVNGRIFVPVASITDAFGAKIMWDEATQTVTIN